MTDKRLTVAKLNRRMVLRGAAALGVGAAFAKVNIVQAATPLKVNYPSRSGISWPMWIAKDAGFYKKHDIDAELTFGVHPAGMAAVISGEAQMTIYGLEQLLAASVRDPILTAISCPLSKSVLTLVARKGIKSIAELKGKRIGIGRLGDPPYFYTVNVLESAGLKPNDVQWISSGNDSATRANMLRGNQLDASLLTIQVSFKLEDEGYANLGRLADFSQAVVGTGYVFKKDWAAANADTIERMIMAHAEAIKLFYADKQAAIDIYRKHDPQPAEEVSRSYDLYVEKQILERIPLISKDALAASVNRIVGQVPALKTFDLNSCIDNKPVAKLIDNHFFEQTFGPAIKDEESRKMAGAVT